MTVLFVSSLDKSASQTKYPCAFLSCGRFYTKLLGKTKVKFYSAYMSQYNRIE